MKLAHAWWLGLFWLGGSMGDRTAEAASQLWAVDCLSKVLPAAELGVNADAALRLSGARGETVSGQAVFRPEKEVPAAETVCSDFRHRESGAVIPGGNVRLQWVRSIAVKRNTAGVPADELVASAPGSIPDPFWEESRIRAGAGRTQPLWIEVEIPRAAVAGEYEGKVIVRAGELSVALPAVLRVWDFELPAERHLAVINWWRFPGLGFEDRVRAHSAEYYELLGRFCAFLAAHRQTDVNASLAELLPSAQRDATETAFDSARLERYAEAAFQAGIQRIHLHSVGRLSAPLLDASSRVMPNEENFRRLPTLEQVIRRRGWQGRFLVSISDEPFVQHEESFAAQVDRVHSLAPSVRCIEAVETEYLGKLDVYVPKLSHLNLWYPRFDEIRRGGAQLWFYTCCHPTGRYPNRFLDQSLLKVRVLHWINYLYDLDGYLHWGLNHFHGTDPFTEEGVSEGLPLGDRAIVYPGKERLLGSLRFSAQRDGLQDYEYLWVLENRLGRLKERMGQEAFWLDTRQRPLELCRRVVWSFHEYTREANTLLETRRAIAEEIEALQSDPLLFVQTSPPEGAVIPAGPRHVIVRGLVAPGATVTLNGERVVNVRPSGYFHAPCFLGDDHSRIRVEVDQAGRKRASERSFRLTD